MMEHGGQQKCRLENDDAHRWDGKDNNDGPPHDGRKQHFAEVKSNRCRHVEKLIEVMHLMESPKERHPVICAMPPINPEV